MNLFFTAFGGFLGSILRYYISLKLNKHFIGTWVANICGSLLFGITIKFHVSGHISDVLWNFAGIGFCGAFTTFSTFGNESLQLILKREFFQAFLYVISSIVLSIILIFYIIKR